MNRKIIWEKQSGLTLIELIIGLAIMALVLTGATSLLNSALSAWQFGKAKVEVEQNLRLGLDNIVREARYALSVNVSDDGNGILVLTLTNHNGDTINFRVNTLTKALTKRVTTKYNTTAGFQPIAGDGTGTSEGNIIIVDNPVAANPADMAVFALQNKLLSVTISAMDKKTGVRATMHTKIFCVNI